VGLLFIGLDETFEVLEKLLDVSDIGVLSWQSSVLH
jgi:hypothetical protein